MNRPLRSIILFILVILLAATAIVFIFPLKGNVPILMYHFVLPANGINNPILDMSQEKFDRQLWFLKNLGFRVISLDQLYEIKTGKAEAKGREVVITFDDGNETYLKYALPVLEKYQFSSANFVVYDFLKKKTSGSMNYREIKRVIHNPLVTIGSHTISHPTLPELNDKQAKKEIFKSKSKLERRFGKKIYYLAYPVGVFSIRDADLVRRAGYRLAFTTSRKRLNGRSETEYSLVRQKVKPQDNLFVFWLRVSGLSGDWDKIKGLLHQLTGKDMNGKLNDYLRDKNNRNSLPINK